MNTDPSRLHQPQHAVALDYARDHARRCLSALKSVDAASMPGDQYVAVGRCAAVLIDMVQDLERIARRL